MPFSRDILPESVLDTALIRLFTARIKLGMFDPPDMVPYTKIDEKELDSAEHRAEARKLANESMVLLKNDGLLPLKPEVRKIAVVGPLADQTRPLIGNYAGQPTHIVSILEGLHAEFPNATITFVPGTQFLRTDGTAVPDALLTTPDGKPGLKADYNEGMRRGPPAPGANTTPIVSRTEANVKLTESNLPAEVAGKKTFGVQWSGFLTPAETGDFILGHPLRRIWKACSGRQAGRNGVRRRRRARIGRRPRPPRKGPQGRARNLLRNQERQAACGTDLDQSE